MSPTSVVTSFFLLATSTSMLAILLPVAESGKIPSRQCYFSGYKPGGNVPLLEDISTVHPEKFESDVMDNVLGYFNEGGTLAVTTLTVIDAMGKTLKGSPQVSAALGVVAVGLGYTSDSPDANDILDRAHKSVQLLSEEVNVRMRQLQDYADGKILELEKRIMSKNYKELFDKWAKCAKHRPERDPNQCQQDAEEDITRARYHFQPLQDLFDAKQSNGKQKYDPNFSYRYVATWQWMKEYEGKGYFDAPTYDQVKRLEIGLIPFRDYAFFHLIVLEALANSFKEKVGEKQGCHSYKHTLDLIVQKSDYYVRYAKWAYEWIYIRQYEENMYFGVKGRSGGGPATATRNGYMATYKCAGGKCTIECSQMVKDKVCTVQDMEQGYGLCETKMLKLKEAMRKFWTEHVLDVVDRWVKYGEDAKEKLKKLKC